MPSYAAPIRDMQFVLDEVLEVSKSDVPGYADLEPAFTSAILDEAGKIARDVLAPLNATGDREGCRLENGVVRTPEGFRQAFQAMKDGGWNGLDLPEAPLEDGRLAAEGARHLGDVVVELERRPARGAETPLRPVEDARQGRAQEGLTGASATRPSSPRTPPA